MEDQSCNPPMMCIDYVCAPPLAKVCCTVVTSQRGFCSCVISPYNLLTFYIKGAPCDTTHDQCALGTYCAPATPGGSATCQTFGTATFGSPCTFNPQCPDGAAVCCYVYATTSDDRLSLIICKDLQLYKLPSKVIFIIFLSFFLFLFSFFLI